MGAYNGAPYIEEQISSIVNQSWTNWLLTISDDGSEDETRAIISGRQKDLGERVKITDGPQRGFQANFLALAARDETGADYFAWADQDDIWLPHRLARAMEIMAPFGQREPALYCGRTVLVDKDNREYGLSPLMNRRPPGFGNALTQSIGGGNTMIFNQAARNLIVLGDGQPVVSHDWWAYMIVSGAGGKVIYDAEPTLRYRQHRGNLIGSNRGPLAKFSRLAAFLKGRWRHWNGMNLAALSKAEAHLRPDNREKLAAMISIHQGDIGACARVKRLHAAGLLRQSRLDVAAMSFMALCKLM